jgi:hypothetical protein
VNHVERHALLCGFSVERVRHDYGIDLYMFTYNQKGETENGYLQFQIKATDRLAIHAGGKLIAIRISRADLLAWLGEPMPVILIIFDAKAEVAYWLFIQEYLEGHPSLNLSKVGKEVTIHLPRSNVVDQSAMRRFASFRDQLLARLRGGTWHHA